MENIENNLYRTLTTPGELAEALKQTIISAEPEIDITKLKYVLYCRKSTTGDEKQERSIEDQTADCIEMQVKKNKLNLIETIEEKESAKAPGIRPKFKKMLEDIQKGKYDAVLSWHPDRLARNMKDAGEIIYLLEENIIKDLRFATFTFENSPMGKMLLGMSFVLSKQYSDHLSEQVTRGQKRKTLAGLAIHVPKHGYIKDVDKRFRPDTENNNWVLIKTALQMRLAGKQYKEIKDFLNTNKYTRAPAFNKKRNMNYRVDDNVLTKLFSDPVYCGVLQYGNEVCNLMEIYNFIPMISVQEYCELNNYTFNGFSFITKRPIGQPRLREKLLRGVVKCGECGSNMIAGITSKYTKKKVKTQYYMFRCNNPKCSLHNKSVRSKVALQFIYDLFKKFDFTSKAVYEQLVKEKEGIAEEIGDRLNTRLKTLKQERVEREKTYDRTKKILLDKDPEMMRHYTGDLDTIEGELKRIDEEITDTKKQLSNLADAIPTYKKYFELFKDMVKILINTRNMRLKDQIIRKYVLNLTLKAKKISERSDGKPVLEWSVSDYKLHPTYEKLLLIKTGGPERNRTSNLIIANDAFCH